MRSFERDYKYLLHNLIPQHRLSRDRRRRIQKVVRTGDPREIRLESILALEELCRTDYYRRGAIRTENDSVILTYVRDNGFYQVRLQLPAGEWRRLGIDGGEWQTTPVTTPRAAASVDIIPQVIESLSINDHHQSTVDRLESVLELVPVWLGVSGSRLVLDQERFGERSGPSPVTTLPGAAILRNAIYERCHRSGQVEVIDDEAARTFDIPRPSDSPGAEELQVAVAPVVALGEFCGVLEVWAREEQDSVELIQRVKVALGVCQQIIENADRLQTMTSIDKLTRIYNRGFYDKQVQIEIERATRSAAKLTMLILDIDDFKKINDTLGHQKGDEVLVLVADLVSKNLRKIDLPFRYGGEEFVVLLPGTAEVEAIHTAERLRSVIEESNAFRDQDDMPQQIRVSIGAAVFPDHARTEEELFMKADSALYRAKRKGKNRVEFHRD